MPGSNLQRHEIDGERDQDRAGHMLVHFLPGDGTDLSPGRRRLNCAWYVGACEQELDRFLTDKDGRRHHASLPQGMASSALIAEICKLARREVHSMFAELVAATPDAFVQTIVDVVVPQTAFGRVMLLGDAAFVVRPHTAGRPRRQRMTPGCSAAIWAEPNETMTPV